MSRVHSDRGLMNTNMKWKIKHHFNTAGNHSDCNKLRDRTFPTTKNSLIRLKWFSKLNYNKRMAKCWTSFACVPGSCLGPLACVPGGVLHDSPSMCYPEPNDLCPYPHGRAAFDSTGHPTEVMMGNCPTLQCKLHWFCLGPPVCLDYLPPPPPSKQASILGELKRDWNGCHIRLFDMTAVFHQLQRVVRCCDLGAPVLTIFAEDVSSKFSGNGSRVRCVGDGIHGSSLMNWKPSSYCHYGTRWTCTYFTESNGLPSIFTCGCLFRQILRHGCNFR